MWELNSLVQTLLQAPVATGMQVNQDIMFNVVRAIAGEHRQLLISFTEADIEKKLFLNSLRNSQSTFPSHT